MQHFPRKAGEMGGMFEKNRKTMCVMDQAI